MDADVVVAGAGPTGLMLAAELRLAGVHVLVLERQPAVWAVPKANGIAGQILELLRYRGLLDRIEAEGGATHPAPRYPFGDVHVDFSSLADPPLRGVTIPQPRLETLLDEHARELGAEIRRGHEVVGFVQDDAGVTVDVGTYQVTARYLVGCDGGRSRIRELAGITFPGTTYPEVNRLGQFAYDVEVPGLTSGTFTRTDTGLFGFGHLAPGVTLISTAEDEPTEYDDTPMTLTEFQHSIRRVLGTEIPLKDPIRLSRYQSQSRQAPSYRAGRVFLAGDAAHQFPTTGIGLNAGMLDAANLAWKLAATVHGWAPTDLLDTYHGERHHAGTRAMLHSQAQVALRRTHDAAGQALRTLFLELLTDPQPLHRLGAIMAGTDLRHPTDDNHPLTGTFAPDLPLHTATGPTTVATLMRPAGPVLLDLADTPALRAMAHPWRDRVDIHTATTPVPPAPALLLRPDAHIAWTASPTAPPLQHALHTWFGPPLDATR
ncbi:FAD-dependent monooxygenase [Actinokineospora inagensis]|uniref:FAD-dependent monooxygenase n=1 Tax=Actinokineospora inagensis TaxID=103730 RepID=UPI00047B0D6E|nr:FAD-dependent monooxygenase [Actinokineospora inagensis]